MSEWHRLYKLRSFASEEDRNRLRATLIDRQIWFSSPVDFNDPFDCLFSVSMSGIDESVFRDWTAEQAKAHVEQWFFNDNCKDVCVYSLSARNDDNLM